MDLPAKTNVGTIERAKGNIYNALSRILGLRLPPSPTPHLLYSNILPTDEEIPLIVDTISQAEAEAGRLRTALASKRTTHITTIQVKLIKAHLDKVNENIVRHKTILSPIRRLPPDVLEEIFIFSISDCETSTMGSNDFNRTPHCIPQIQSRVCKLWRSVALSNSRFWSHLPTIDLDRPYSKKQEFLAFLADILDRRCGEIPINFHVVTRHRMDYEPHPALALLVSHSNKWKTAILDLSRIKEAEIAGIKGRIPQLQTLVLSYSSYSDREPPTLDIFQNAPQLRKAVVVRGGSTLILLPHHKLVHYRDDCYGTQSSNFSKFTALHTLEIGHHCVPEGGVIRLSNLVVLRVRVTSLPGQFRNPLGSFILPGLKELSISCRLQGSVEVDVILPILDMILRSEQPSVLERLYVRSTGVMEAWKLTSLLQHVPLLTHLNINFPPLVDITQMISNVVPLLQVCTFYSVGMLDKEQADLCNRLALARCEVDGRVTAFHNTPAVQCILRIDHHFWTPNAQQRILHGWEENSTTQTLKAYRHSLINHLYQKVRPPDLSSLLSGDYYTNITLSTLTLTQQITVTRAEDLYISGLLRMLHHIINQFPSNTKSWKESFCQKSELILEKWKPLIDSSLDYFHWAIDGQSIFYIPRSSPVRKSPEIMTKIVAEQLRASDIRLICPPWPSVEDEWR